MSSELLKRLGAASACLLQFQQLAFPEMMQTRPPMPDTLLRPASFPSPAPYPSALYSTPSTSGSSDRDHIPSDRNSVSQPFADASTDASAPIGEPSFSRDSMSPSLGSDCCGGFVDCTDLADEEQDELQEDELGIPVSLVQTSGMRSTSNRTPPTIA